MSVYTPLSTEQLKQFLSTYDVGHLVSAKGAEEGIENTNYFIETRQNNRPRHFVLTLFEALTLDELPFYVNLMCYLAGEHLPVPAPLSNKEGLTLSTVKHKPAILVPRLPGKHIPTPTKNHCQLIGTALAKIHAAGENFPQKKDNDRGLSWWLEQKKPLKTQLKDDDYALLATALQNIECAIKLNPDLPQGIIHGDLFHDNTLFSDGTLTGIIDFYNACHDYLLLDIAIVINDWCVDNFVDTGIKNPVDKNIRFANNKATCVLQSYSRIRALTVDEKRILPLMLQAAAIRFWLSRLLNQKEVQAHAGAMAKYKDPDEMKALLIYHINYPYTL